MGSLLRVIPHPLRNAVLALAILAVSVPTVSAQSPPSLVANVSVPIDTISRDELRAIYSLRTRQFADGSAITLVVLPDTDPLHRSFSVSVLNVFPYMLREIWTKKTFTGVAHPPLTVTSQDELIEHVSRMPGTIGYVSARPSTVLQGIKYLEIE